MTLNINARSALTRKQVAVRLGVSEGTMARWAMQHKGPPFVKIGSAADGRGGRCWYPVTWLDTWIRSRPTGGEEVDDE